MTVPYASDSCYHCQGVSYSVVQFLGSTSILSLSQPSTMVLVYAYTVATIGAGQFHDSLEQARFVAGHVLATPLRAARLLQYGTSPTLRHLVAPETISNVSDHMAPFRRA